MSIKGLVGALCYTRPNNHSVRAAGKLADSYFGLSEELQERPRVLNEHDEGPGRGGSGIQDSNFKLARDSGFRFQTRRDLGFRFQFDSMLCFRNLYIVY